MSTAKAQHVLLDRLGAASTVLLSVHLDLPEVPDWCDSVDAYGRAVVLVGRWQLGDSDTAKATVQAVLDALQAGELPDGVVGIDYKPKASAAIAEIVAGEARHILLDGPRASGKTQAVPGALAILAELHVRAGYPSPLEVLWLHSSLKLASDKTGASLQEWWWQGLWHLRDDSSKAVLTIAGTEVVRARFVGCIDASASELLRAACHVVACEELVQTQDDAGGIQQQDYMVAVSSMIGRLLTRRYVGISTTNPGDPSGWVYERWIQDGGQPHHVRCPVPASDRLTAEQAAELWKTYDGSPELQKRLAEGEWVALILGKPVAQGFNQNLHVAKQRLRPIPGEPLFLGQDFGLTPATIIGQPVRGYLYIYAALPCERGGVRQHFEGSVIPWLTAHAPWALRSAMTYVRGCYDPAGETGEESDSDQNPIATVEKMIGGIWTPGPVKWDARNNCLLSAINRHVAPGVPALQLDPEDCRVLIAALNGRWFYAQDRQGHVCRDLPKKPNHPYEDLGDALIYLLSELVIAPSHEPREIKVETEFDPRAPVSLLGPRF